MYNSGRNQLTSDLLDALAKGNVREKNAAQYGQALQAMEASKYDEARKALQPLLAADPNNPWYLDLSTDIDLGQKKTTDAINRLKGRKMSVPTRCCSLTWRTLTYRAVSRVKRRPF
jgi:predicted Zn-dependent protease